MNGDITIWVTQIMDRIGYWGIGVLMFAENLFPPIPSELIMPLAGFNISQGTMAWGPAVIAGTLGTVAGALPWYYLGKAFTAQRLANWADRYGKWLGISGEEIDRSVVWFKHHGAKAVFLGRLVPGIRTLISLPAGIESMPLPVFLLYSTLGTAIWTTFLTGLGFALGENYSRVEQYIGPFSKAAVALIPLSFLFWLLLKRWNRSS